MALTLKDQFKIQIVPAYQAADGKRFHEAAEAQSYTRNAMLDSVIRAATKGRPEYAKLDPVLLRDFLLETGVTVGAVMAEPLAPVDPLPVERERVAAKVEVNIDPGSSAKIADIAATHRANITDPRFGKHPLDTKPLTAAMQAVDDGEADRQIEDDISAALRMGGH